jgi:predicted dehydrogenase
MTSSARPLRLGFVGAGQNTIERHLPGFRATPGVEFVAIANRTLASAERVSAGWNVRRAETDWRSIVSAPDVDAVCVGTWPSLHAEVTCAALAAGKHVLCEARMAADLAGAQAMMAASAARPDLVAQLVPAPHTLGIDALVRDTLAKGRLGPIRSVQIIHGHAEFINVSTPLSWRLQSRHSGVNMLTLGIFYEVLLRWLDADAIVDSAQGMVRPPRRRRTVENEQSEIDLPEELAVQGHFPALDDAPLAIGLSGIAPDSPAMGITLRGERGMLHWDGLAKSVALTSSDEGRTVLAEATPDAWRVEADFVASVRTGERVTRTDFATGLRYMRFTDAVRRAMVWTRDASAMPASIVSSHHRQD